MRIREVERHVDVAGATLRRAIAVIKVQAG